MKKTVVLVGDSIRMGYQATVREELVELAWVRSAAMNGGMTTRVVEHIDEWIVAHKPDVVHMNAGLHDIRRDRDGSGKRQVEIDDYAANLRTIFSRARAETDAVLIWATTTPVIEEQHNTTKPFDRMNADINSYNLVAREIAAEYDVEINDLNALVCGKNAGDLMTGDGVHYTPEGSALLGQVVAARICPHL